MGTRTIKNNGKAPNGILKQVLLDAKEFCSSTLFDKQIQSAIEQISSDADQLTIDQRKQLQEIGKFMAAGHTPTIKALAMDGSFELTLSDDRMYLLLAAKPSIAGGAPVTTSDIIQHLRDQNITAGVDVPKIKSELEKVAQGEEISNVVIVRGKPAKAGTDGRIQIQARKSMGLPLQDMDVNLDAPDPKQNLLCMAGDCVMIHHSAVEGQAGVDAHGKPLAPPPVMDVELTAGENLTVKNNRFTATITGMLEIKDRVLTILPILFFATDVTQLQGPIDFDGQIIVQASVRDGVSLKATGDISVHGNVEAAGIESTQGSIIIKQGVVGRNEAILSAKKDIHARFVENASLRADEDIIIEHGTLRSSLVAGGKIEVTKGKGQIIGGSALAGELIIARTLGNTSNMQTDVSAGLSAKAMKLLAKLDDLRQHHTTSLQACRQIIERMHHLVVRDPSKMDKTSLETLAKLKQIQLVLDVKINRVDQRKTRVMEIASEAHAGKIKVLEDVYPGVRVRLGNELHVQTQQGRAKQFVLDPSGQRILYQPYKP